MGFLDNSGDITLDAVLTDTGRMRLAKGDGSFRIAKFALGDDEINYKLYDKNNIAGTAAYDLNILQTPVFEAFTNNIASLNSRLVSYARNNLLYLPVIKVNDKSSGNNFAIGDLAAQGFIMAVDKDTETYLDIDGLTYNDNPLGARTSVDGLLTGFTPSNGATIRIDQGIDNIAVPPTLKLDTDLMETQYLIEIDNRLAYLIDPDGANIAVPTYIDDDDMAAYYISKGVDEKYFFPNASLETTGQVIQGSRGDTFRFKLAAALEVSTSDYLFNTLGNDETSKFKSPSAGKIMSILSSVNITGLTTGCFLTIPILLLKKIS